MSRRTKINYESDNVWLQYANVISMVVQLIKVKFLYLILGRGTGKTTDILANRAKDISYEMPGAFIAITSDTYMNAMKNVVPSILEGWERSGWVEDIHFVVGKRPPKHFKKPYKPVHNWKHTITVLTGTHFKIVSQDRPSTGAGDSYQHIIGDEVKFQSEKKLNKLTPALRGGDYVKFAKSPYYRGRTFTTDMPNTNHREHDWILRMKKNMNVEQIKTLLQAALVLNEIRTEKLIAEENNETSKVALLEKNEKRWEARVNKFRTESTFYFEGSSYINADILTEGFFQDIIDTMLFGDVKTSILSIEPTLEKGQKFYPNITDKNYFTDSYNYKRVDSKAMTREGFEVESSHLKHCISNEPLEIGLDTGNMCSLPVGQLQGKVYRVFKFLYSLAPEFLPELGEKFRTFFANHQCKEVFAYHDRGANQYKSVGEDHAGKFKKAIEEDKNGNPTGWTCTLMSRDQSTISQQAEYELMLEMPIGGYGLPKLMICKQECKPLKSSIEKAQIVVKTDRDGNKTIHKNKTSEKLAIERLVMESTNPSDGLKYLLCRPEFLNKIAGKLDTGFHF